MRLRAVLISTVAAGGLVVGLAQPAFAANQVTIVTTDARHSAKGHFYKSTNKVMARDVSDRDDLGSLVYWKAEGKDFFNSGYVYHKKGESTANSTDIIPKAKAGRTRQFRVCRAKPNSDKDYSCSSWKKI